MLVRPYRPEDREACLALFDSNVPEFFLAEERPDYEAFLARVPGLLFVVEGDAGELVAAGGIAPSRDAKDDAVLCWGLVRQGLHRRGIGRRLLAARLEAHLALHPTTEKVVVHTSQRSQGFFAKLGFATTEVLVNGYGDGLDQVTMEMRLGRAAQPVW